jgi:hypothetical protein
MYKGNNLFAALQGFLSFFMLGFQCLSDALRFAITASLKFIY